MKRILGDDAADGYTHDSLIAEWECPRCGRRCNNFRVQIVGAILAIAVIGFIIAVIGFIIFLIDRFLG